jgi:hypothetical protein
MFAPWCATGGRKLGWAALRNRALIDPGRSAAAQSPPVEVADLAWAASCALHSDSVSTMVATWPNSRTCSTVLVANTPASVQSSPNFFNVMCRHQFGQDFILLPDLLL